MNLASQTVLEGLNACLDHRGEVYIAELDQVFKRHPDFRLFAAQNPHHQGGGRKGLPSSFVNRFIVVYADVFSKQDLLQVMARKFDQIGTETQHQLIEFMSRLDDEVVTRRSFGALGAPWEFNLRDTLRWGDLLTSQDALLSGRKPDDYLDIIIRQRFRSEKDRQQVNRLFAEVFGREPEDHGLYHDINPYYGQVGLASLKRDPLSQPTPFPSINPVPRLKEIESLMIAVQQDLPCILVGPSGSGKSALLAYVAALAGKSLVIFPLNADVDAMDLIGGFEQADPHRDLQVSLSKLEQALRDEILGTLPNPVSDAAVDLMASLHSLTGEAHEYELLLPLVETLRVSPSISAALANHLAEAGEALRKPLTLENPRFEWLDGVIVRAVETGAWLVLDNANLCSASVLDRLNSLLERPNGILSINEHSGPGGEPRIIKPHPEFRIFLTVDPRYGELSRAMRNRSIEIYLEPLPTASISVAGRTSSVPVEGSLQRFHAAAKILEQQGSEDRQLVSLAFDVLSLNDTNRLNAYAQAARDGFSHSAPSLLRSPAALEYLGQLTAYIHSEDAASLRQAIANLYAASPERMLMPLHPLINSPIIQLLEHGREGAAFWLASCYEFFLDILRSETAMEAQLARVNVSKPSSLNRLQRSWVADKVASLSKDSTVNAVRFLTSALRAVRAFVCETSEPGGSWKLRSAVLRRLLLFWKRTFRALIASSFEEARFQAHLTQGLKLLAQCISALQGQDSDQKLLTMLVGFLERDFVVGFKLSTGLSMEVLWHQLRPDPIPDLQTLEQVAELERLADRFDALRWLVDVNISTLRTVQDSMARVYAFVRTGKGTAGELVKDLQSEITALEQKIGEHSSPHQPFFASSFEGLRQALVLHQVSQEATLQQGSSDVDVLSNLPTVTLMRLQCLKRTPLQAVDYILAQDTNDVHPWEGTLSKSLLLRYDAASSASLHELRSLEVEMPIMGRVLAGASEALSTDPLIKAEKLLLKLLDQVLCAHGELFKGQAAAIYHHILNNKHDDSPLSHSTLESWLTQSSSLQLPQEVPQHLSVIFEKHFAKAFLALAASARGFQPRSASTSVAWVRFALGCVELFVPDKIFDPHHRAQTEAEEHQELYDSLQQQIASLEAFEFSFTGQRTTSLRAKILAEEAQGLGEPPTVQQIYRPDGSELRGLQSEFNNVLSALINNDVAATHLRSFVAETAGDAAEELALVEQNVVLLIGRLSTRFGAYQDMTMPLVSFLRCLRFGLSLGRGLGTKPQQSEEGDYGALVGVTPFLGGNVWKAQTAGETMPVRTLEFLALVQTIAAVEGRDKLPVSLRRMLHESLAAFHEEWSKKLEADRKAEQAKTSLYRFKGSFEDQEEFDQEEFDQLFPDYTPDEDGVTRPKKKPRHGSRELSVLLAEAHEKIFLQLQEPQQSMRELVAKVARRFIREKRDLAIAEPELDRVLLPAAFLVFDEQVKAFNSEANQPGESSTYNFYTDPNLAEVRKVLSLVSAIKMRFLELQGIDEIGHHQTLADVVQACDKILLDMAIDDPLARVITAIERLYAHVYEWHEGGWATREHKAIPLYEKLRDIICHWRRLELSSWSRLLDDEIKKHYEDAKSWWFIAYGAVILKPCAILQQGLDLKEHTVELLGILESYFTGATVGQFAARLCLLQQLKNQLDLLVVDEPALTVVRDAVANFIVYYGRYQNKVRGFISAGREPLDRSMKDVLLMSKWRDKNIEALRDSARKSHAKLFKIVRKFRAVLEQPIKCITDQGLPEEDYSSVSTEGSGVKMTVAAIPGDQKAISVCQQTLPGIQSHPHWTRISNLPVVLKAIAKYGTVPAVAINAAETLDTYVSDLVSSIASLRKETPSELTDENKELVRHLKTRKVALYSDTLKTLRAMGFSRNLGTNVLAKQGSTAVVLVDSGLVSQPGCAALDATEYYYHKMLDLAPRFRHASLEHSDDLNREVVNRSIGYLEGVLHVMFRQRQFLARASQAERNLHAVVDFVKELSTAGAGLFKAEKRPTNHAQVVRWLVQILRLGIYLVDVHSKHGGIDNSDVRKRLDGWAETFAKLDAAQDNLPRLPDGFGSVPGDELRKDVEKELEVLRNGLNNIARNRPDLAFVMQQIQLWTSIQTTEVIDGIHESESIDNFAAAALTLSSKVLVALQNFRKAAKSLPTTTEDAGWLIQYSDSLQQSIDALRMTRITQEVESLFGRLRALTTDQDTATALLRLVYPILSQYLSVCSHNLSRFVDLHRTTCRLGYQLAASFVQIASQGFCTPQEKSNEESGETGQVESGTGLGEGEGAEDISKDIKPDEDLSELAQDPNNNLQGDIEHNEDAVDMGEDELEGELGSVSGEDEDEKDGKDKDGEEEEEMDEQAGDVDDLDPTTVDEKMWDGTDEDEAEKDQIGDKEKGKKDDDQSAAVEKDKKDQQKGDEPQDDEGNAPPDEAGDEDAEAEPGQEMEGMREEPIHQDPTAQETDTLQLPEDMDIEIDDEGDSDEDDLDDLSDIEKAEDQEEPKVSEEVPRGDEEEGEEDKREEEHQKDENIAEEEAEEEEEIDAAGDREEEMEVDEKEQEQGKEEDGENEENERNDEKKQPLPDDGTSIDQENAAPSEVKNGGGQAQEEDADMQDEDSENKTGQREQGALGKQAAEEDKAPGGQGVLSQLDQDQGQADKPEDDRRSQDAQPFKKLGDALERWYRNQRDIQAASEDQDQKKSENSSEDLAKAEFQHLQDENAEADTQALGTATNEEAKPMDDVMAIDNEMEQTGDQIMPEDDEEEEQGDVEMEDVDSAGQQDAAKNDREDGRSGVATRKGAYETDDKDDLPQTKATSEEDLEDEQIKEASSQLLATHISDEQLKRPLRDYGEALEMWSTFQTKTQALSQSLSSQLRLILTPTQSTKLSGAFRTGKRLNIKKIIPYIASSYKRDKIWMRRAIPSKRAYQILLCVDDSSSMSDDNRSTAGNLALESLVMVARALTVLEAGQIGVMGFGTDVFVAHALTDPPFTSQDAGARVLQQFTFRQDSTDMVLLLRRTIDHFREARLIQASSSRGGEDLWQLALILSDGLVQSRDHARLRPLLREAMEQRVMVVFIVMDDARSRKGHSVLELKEARFGPDGVPVIHRYLDSFPFPYYLIVHHLEDLPGALAALLRTWFAEVNS